MQHKSTATHPPWTRIVGLCALTSFLVYGTGVMVPPQPTADHPYDFCQIGLLPPELPLGEPPQIAAAARVRDAPSVTVRLVSRSPRLSRGPPA